MSATGIGASVKRKEDIRFITGKGHQLEERTIREELEGNICRCTGYHNIVKAIAAGAKAMRGGQSAKAAE